jgi:HSP20 family molecular chaperone IbpA
MERIEPRTYFFADEKAGRLRIEVKLPGAEEKDVALEMKNDNFCLRAPKGKEAEYSGCFPLPQEIESDKFVVRFESECLKISAPAVRDWTQRIIYRRLG